MKTTEEIREQIAKLRRQFESMNTDYSDAFSYADLASVCAKIAALQWVLDEGDKV